MSSMRERVVPFIMQVVRAWTMWKHLRAIILLPGIVTLVLPSTILWRGGIDTLGLWPSFPASRIVLPTIGSLCICLGLLLIPLLEEPGLVKRFGEDYLSYKRNVPRWIPRWTPWGAGATDAS
jgi:protein-S-isoprenylcysteine O-methyltransferase Ste14